MIGLAMVLLIYFLLSLAHHALQEVVVHDPNIGIVDYSHPYPLLLTLMVHFRTKLYLPLVFLALLWVRARHTDQHGFTTQQMGWITMSVGGLLLGCSFFFMDYRPSTGFQLFYSCGWCLLFAGLICQEAVHRWSEHLHMGMVAFLMGLGWIIFGISGIKIGQPSVMLLMVDMVSFIVCILGLLSMKKIERWLAFTGLVLILIYGWGLRSENAWFPLRFSVEWLYTIPGHFLFFLAWGIVFGWGFGLFRKWGHPLEVKTLNSLG